MVQVSLTGTPTASSTLTASVQLVQTGTTLAPAISASPLILSVKTTYLMVLAHLAILDTKSVEKVVLSQAGHKIPSAGASTQVESALAASPATSTTRPPPGANL